LRSYSHVYKSSSYVYHGRIIVRATESEKGWKIGCDVCISFCLNALVVRNLLMKVRRTDMMTLQNNERKLS